MPSLRRTLLPLGHGVLSSHNDAPYQLRARQVVGLQDCVRQTDKPVMWASVSFQRWVPPCRSAACGWSDIGEIGALCPSQGRSLRPRWAVADYTGGLARLRTLPGSRKLCLGKGPRTATVVKTAVRGKKGRGPTRARHTRTRAPFSGDALVIELCAADVGAEGEEAGRLAVRAGVAEIPSEPLVGGVAAAPEGVQTKGRRGG